METCNGDETDNPILVRRDDEVISEAKWNGFKLCGDNIDKTVKPRNMTISKQSQSFNYFNSYAVLDRIDMSLCSEEAPLIDLEPDMGSILPSNDNKLSIIRNMAVLVARILVKNISFFKLHFEDAVEYHIKHKFTKEMSTKSEVVNLGIYLHSERSYDEFLQILDKLEKYIPKKIVEHDGLMREVHHQVLLGGDQMTAARARGSKMIRMNSTTDSKRLTGLLPVSEDWHTKVILLEIIWKRLYSTVSITDHGTLQQLRNLINRRNVVSDPKKDVNATEDFLNLVTTSYVLCVAMQKLKMKEIDSSPSVDVLDIGNTKEERKEWIITFSEEIASEYVDLSTFNSDRKIDPEDHVYEYAKEMISLGLFYMEYHDAIREGDGDRVFNCWKYMLIMFRATSHWNYALEAFTLLAQYHWILPE
ncbi:PREDICTED: uncharacterized protein LOC109592137, partial [Amphimedon queenslandica]|uniref:DUF6589 domain-containing protein n=1 Tax=Amphimedon queenslandica TaxID=400682 RepID=A0AAN0K1T0_AMPQE